MNPLSVLWSVLLDWLIWSRDDRDTYRVGRRHSPSAERARRVVRVVCWVVVLAFLAFLAVDFHVV